MAWNQMVERVQGQVRRWLGRPLPVAAPARPQRTMAEVELPPLIALNKGKRYHKPDCGFVQNPQGQLVPFRSRQEAQDRGLAPCQVCQPSLN